MEKKYQTPQLLIVKVELRHQLLGMSETEGGSSSGGEGKPDDARSDNSWNEW